MPNAETNQYPPLRACTGSIVIACAQIRYIHQYTSHPTIVSAHFAEVIHEFSN